MDLSKAFDTLNHDLLVAKLHAYGFDIKALSLINSYLTNRWQRTKVNLSFSKWSELLTGVPQGSVLGPLLFNIFINDFFYLFEDKMDVCNYADDNTIHTSDISLDCLMAKIEEASGEAITWFAYNGMKLNPDKCKLLVSGNKHEVMIGSIADTQVIETHCVKLLGVLIDSELKFDAHVNSLCKKASSKISALARQCAILPFCRRKMLMNAFFSSQFSFCPLVWMFCSRAMNSKINNLHYRALRIVYRDDISTFEELLQKDRSVTVHHRNLQFLAIEMFKVDKGLAPSFMANIFYDNANRNSENVSANTRSRVRFYNPSNPRTRNYGLETLRCLGPKIWELLPSEIQNASSLELFKTKIKCWKPVNCPCRLCLNFIANLGYI